MSERNIKFFLQMAEHFDVKFAALAFERYTGIAVQLTHGDYWGGWHGGAAADDYNFQIFMNPYNVGHGVEYHRPEVPWALVIVRFDCTLIGFRKFESDLAGKPGVLLLETGFERNLPTNHTFRPAIQPQRPG